MKNNLGCLRPYDERIMNQTTHDCFLIEKRGVRSVVINFLYVSVALFLQSCNYLFDDDAPYSEYNSRWEMEQEIYKISTKQLNEYIESDKILSSFKLDAECYEAYSIIPATRSSVAVNIANQRGCFDIRVYQHIHKILLLEDMKAKGEIVEVLCQSTAYDIAEIESAASNVQWQKEEPICPSDINGNDVIPKYRRYGIESDPSLRPEFRKWEFVARSK